MPTFPLWRFEQLATGDWVWDRQQEDGSSRRKGPFRTFETCVNDALQNGFEAGMQERGKSPGISHPGGDGESNEPHPHDQT